MNSWNFSSPWNIEISKYSADQTFRAQCHGHGASGVAHAAHSTTTTTVSNEMEIDPTVQTTTQMSPINVRARFMDMPDVNLKFGVNESENESLTISSTVSASKMDTNTGRMYSGKTVFDGNYIFVSSNIELIYSHFESNIGHFLHSNWFYDRASDRFITRKS